MSPDGHRAEGEKQQQGDGHSQQRRDDVAHILSPYYYLVFVVIIIVTLTWSIQSRQSHTAECPGEFLGLMRVMLLTLLAFDSQWEMETNFIFKIKFLAPTGAQGVDLCLSVHPKVV